MSRRFSLNCVVASVLVVLQDAASGFAPHQPRSDCHNTRQQSPLLSRNNNSQLHMNKFRDLLNNAFANDSSLSRDDFKLGQLEDPSTTENEPTAPRTPTLTSTQRNWRQQMFESNTVTTKDLHQLSVSLDLYLTGIPDKDPSNDLYAAKVNISSRDRQVGLALPEQPTVSNLSVIFLSDGTCRANVNDDDDDDVTFVQPDAVGDWLLSEDGSQLRFRVGVTGYARRVETKGTIQKVYWSQDEEQTTATTTTYSIPAGWLYGEIGVSKKQQTRDKNTPAAVVWEEQGICKVEQSMGLLGVATKMVPCGKFVVTKSERSSESS